MWETLPLDQLGFDSLLLHLFVQENRLLMGGIIGRRSYIAWGQEFEVWMQKNGCERFGGRRRFVELCDCAVRQVYCQSWTQSI